MPAFVPRIGRLRGRGTLEFFDEAVEGIIERRRACDSRDGREPPRDLLTLLLAARDPETGDGLPEANIRANIITFINAGHETTANALTWTLYLARARRNGASAQRAKRLPFLIPNIPRRSKGARCCARSSTRRCVSIRRSRFSTREAIRHDTNSWPPRARGDHRPDLALCLAPATWVFGTIPTPSILRDSWVNGAIQIDRFAYIPFGAGPRVCIGMAFAIPGGYFILLAHLLRAFRFELVEGHPVMPQATLNFAPAGGHENARKTARIGGKFSTAENFFVKNPLTEKRQGPICGSPNDGARF